MKAGEVVAGKYRLDARIGIGGMGEVWRATHTGTEREFALKFMHPHVATSSTARQRFTREARVSAKINHPNVIDIFDVGEVEDGVLFLAMELLTGVSLADALHAEKPLSTQDFLSIMLDTSRALVAAHAAGVVHRDLKPGNIFLNTDRATGLASAKILDFGISKLGGESEQTKTGAVLGSPRYMSPEQTRSAASVDYRSDLWAMGVILFEGLTGTWPHEGDSFSSLVVAICTVPPTSIDLMVPGLAEPLRAIVRDCLKPLDQRLSRASELAERLAAAVALPGIDRLPLPRPLHPPSDSVRTVTSVRIRPPVVVGRARGADEDATQVRAPPSRRPVEAPAEAPAQAPPATPRPSGFKPTLKTIPLKHGEALHAEMMRAGVFGPPSSSSAPSPASVATPTSHARAEPRPPDSLLGTVSRNNFETRPSIASESSFSSPPAPLTPPPAPIAAAARPAPGRALGLIAAVLSIMLLGIVVALVSILRSGPSGAPGSAASAPEPAASASAVAPAPSASAEPASAPAASASASASASAPSASAEPLPSASAAPVEPASTSPSTKPRPAPRRARPSKIKQLGSGL